MALCNLPTYTLLICFFLDSQKQRKLRKVPEQKKEQSDGEPEQKQEQSDGEPEQKQEQSDGEPEQKQEPSPAELKTEAGTEHWRTRTHMCTSVFLLFLSVIIYVFWIFFKTIKLLFLNHKKSTGEPEPKKEQSDGEPEPKKEQSDGEPEPKKEQSDGEPEPKKEQSDGEPEQKKEQSDGEPEPKKEQSDGEPEQKKEQSDGEPEQKKKQSDGEPEQKKKQSDGEPEMKKKQSDGEPEQKKKQSDGEPEMKKKQSDGEPEQKKKQSDGEPEQKKEQSDGEPEQKKKQSDGEPEQKKKQSDGEPEQKKKQSDGEPEQKKEQSDGEPEQKKKQSDGEPEQNQEQSDGEPEQNQEQSDGEPEIKKEQSDGEQEQKKKQSDGEPEIKKKQNNENSEENQEQNRGEPGEPVKTEELLGKLGLDFNSNKKLIRSHFLEITQNLLQNEEPREEKDLVPAFMQRLLTIDYRARHVYIKAKLPTQKSQGTVRRDGFSALKIKHTITRERKQSQIHPMDIQMAVFFCADPFLQQMIITKLSQCQYAVPLLVPNPFSGDIDFPLWMMRQISKSWKTTYTSGEVISKTLPMYKAETPMVAFFRLGSISSSKSQLINSLINKKHDTFFHRNCPGSSRDRLLMDGVVEIAWYLPSGKNTDHFTDCVAFCNLHGDSSTNVTQRKILTEIASVNVVLLPKLDENDNNKVIVQDLWKSSTPLIVVLTDEEDDDEDAVCEIGESKYRVTLKGRNQSEVSDALRDVIKNSLFQRPVTFRLEKMAEYAELKLDEVSEACQRGKAAAQEIISLLEKEDPSKVKETYLPCHGQLWHDWCKKNKDKRRLKSNNIELEKSKKQEEMMEIRRKQQKFGFTELIRLFVGSLNSLPESERMYFLKWTAVLLDDFTSDKLADILQEYDKKWTEVLNLKKTPKQDKQPKQVNTQENQTSHKSKNHNPEDFKTNKLKSEQTNLEKISNRLNAATFGLEHMLREIGQIYEASVSEKTTENRNLSYLPGLAAELMISGHPMELMDGDAAHVPLIWISAVLDELINKLGDQRVFVLSVLGIQSSGKSTMLNAMFGLQFAVSAGRCTRGAFMQLVKVSEEMKKELKTDYILVVDTEGLRALELAGKNTFHHDNELSTFVVGLGHMTLINIFGENPGEMQDILQIVVQAFMRMKKVRLNPSCMFVHQNVTAVAAGEKMMEGRRRLQEKLDEMTQLAAEDEVCEAQCFSDVITFDVQNDVKYFSQLWEGNPPMAPPNPNYSENVQELKRDIISRASKIKSLKLSQFKQRVEDLWNALLNENFVFSFRNTLEISVYRKLEEEYEKWTWSLRSAVLSIEDKMMNRIASGKMETVEKQELLKEMAGTLQDVEEALKVYFEEDSEKETLIQWENRFKTQIQHLHDDLVDEAKRKLDDNLKQKNIKKHLDDQMMNYEETLFEKSKELAMKLKEAGNKKQRDPKTEFDSVWRKWVSDLVGNAPKIKDSNISEDVINILGQFYESRQVLCQKESTEYRKIEMISDYQNYVSMKEKNFKDKFKNVFWRLSLEPEDQNSIRELISKVTEQAKRKVKSSPVLVQGYSAAYIHEIARDVKQLVQDFQTEEKSFMFKKEFFVDLSLYVCDQAGAQFEDLHMKFKEANDPLIYFEKKKAEYFKVFEKYWQGATSAAVLGDQICCKLKETILQSVYNMISTFICGQMRGRPPFTGNRSDLEKHFLKSLAEQKGNKEENFNNFLTYLYQPKTYFENFIRDKVREFTAAENPQAVSVIKEHIEHKQKSVISAAEMARDKVKNNNEDVKMWLDKFSNSLEDELGDTRVNLTSFDSEEINCDVLVEVLKKELQCVAEELKRSFRNLSDLRKEMYRESPDEILIKHFCKCCWEKCPFCGAVCTNSLEDHTGDHNVDFHRSSAINRNKWVDTTEFYINFCTTSVASDCRFKPGGSEQWFPYKQYRSAGGKYANWLISSDFSELCYWKWFVCEFQENLEKHHKLTFSGRGEIPAEWKKFSQSDAVKSLGLKE